MLTGLIAAALAAAPASPPMKGNGPWTVQFADKMCAMGRNFAAPDGPVTLIVKAPLLGEDYTFTLASPADPAKKAAIGGAHLINANGARVGPFYLTSFTSTTNQRVSRFSIDGERFKLRNVGSVLAIDLEKDGMLAFAVTGLPKALDKLEECAKGLRGKFGIDQQMLDRATTQARPVKPLVSAFRSEDYPVETMKKSEQGTVGALFFINREGRAEDCKAIESSGSKVLDRQTCAIIVNRARFTPARDAQGVVVRVPSYARISWQLGG